MENHEICLILLDYRRFYIRTHLKSLKIKIKKKSYPKSAYQPCILSFNGHTVSNPTLINAIKYETVLLVYGYKYIFEPSVPLGF